MTAVLDLALHSDQKPVALADISNRQGISLSYLEQLFSRLRRNDLVVSVKGPGGGYLLGRSSADIYVAEVIDAVNESVDVTRCRGNVDCQQGVTCLTHHLWQDLSCQIHTFLGGISLSDLMARGDIRDVACRQDQQSLAKGLIGTSAATRM